MRKEVKLPEEMNTDELINYCNSIKPYIHSYIAVELLKRLEIAMEIIAHDSQQQSNH